MAAFKSVHFSKNLVVCLSAGPKILDFGSHCSANFQPILDCFIPHFKLKYEDSENIKTDHVSTVVFNLHSIKRRTFFWDTLFIGKTFPRCLLYCLITITLARQYSAIMRCAFAEDVFHTILMPCRKKWAKAHWAITTTRLSAMKNYVNSVISNLNIKV